MRYHFPVLRTLFYNQYRLSPKFSWKNSPKKISGTNGLKFNLSSPLYFRVVFYHVCPEVPSSTSAVHSYPGSYRLKFNLSSPLYFRVVFYYVCPEVPYSTSPADSYPGTHWLQPGLCEIAQVYKQWTSSYTVQKNTLFYRNPILWANSLFLLF